MYKNPYIAWPLKPPHHLQYSASLLIDYLAHPIHNSNDRDHGML